MTVSVDHFGRVWDLPAAELCPECRQPDNCGDCNHEPLSEDQVRLLSGRLQTGTRVVRFRHMRPHYMMRSTYLVPPTGRSGEEIRADVALCLAKYRQEHKEIEGLKPPKWYGREVQLSDFPDHLTIAEAKRLRAEWATTVAEIKRRADTRKTFGEWMGELGYRPLAELLENEIDGVDVLWDNNLQVLIDEYDF